MEPSSFSHNRAFREWRRFRIWELHQQGWKQQAIADALDITQGAVSQTLTRAKQGGTDALKRRSPKRARPKLTSEQRTQLPVLLSRGAEAFGFSGDAWTCERVAAVILREFKVVYHPADGVTKRRSVVRPSARTLPSKHGRRTACPTLKRGRSGQV